MSERRRKFWGWGWEGEGLTREELKLLDPVWAKRLGVHEFDVIPPPTAEEIHLRPSRVSIPNSPKRFAQPITTNGLHTVTVDRFRIASAFFNATSQTRPML